MGKILLIEDDGVMRNWIIGKLRNKHEVEIANNYISAISRWNANAGFDCIILDLNTSPTGLDVHEVSRYFPIHGILVLDKICEAKIPNGEEWEKWREKTLEEKKVEIWKKTIVFSGYTEVLKGKNEEFPNYKYLIKLIDKGKGNSVLKLMEEVSDFFNR